MNQSYTQRIGGVCAFVVFLLLSVFQTVQAQSIQIGDRIWLDTNVNGIQDSGETGFSGVTITLVRAGTTVATTTTNANGNYYFDDSNVTGGILARTSYELRVSATQSALNSYELAPPDLGSNDGVDSDASLIGTDASIGVFVIDARSTISTYDFGFSLKKPDLELTKTVTTSGTKTVEGNAVKTAVAGEVVSFVLTLKNVGLGSATGVEITDVLQAGVFSSSNATPSTGTYSNGIWSIPGTISPNQSLSLSISATVATSFVGGVITNNAYISKANQKDQNITLSTDPSKSDSLASVCFTVPIKWCAGDAFVASGIVPTGASVQWYKNGVSLGAAGQSANLTITATGNYTMQYTSTTGAQLACNYGSCCPICVENGSCVKPPDLEITKTVITASNKVIGGTNTPTAQPGQEVKYVVTLKNVGQGNATGVEITDVLPAGVFSSSNATPGVGTFTNGIWSIPGTVSTGQSMALTISATIAASYMGGVVVNNAYISKENEQELNTVLSTDPTKLDSVASVCFTVPIKWCAGERLVATAAVPQGSTIQWYKDGLSLGASGQSPNLTITDTGNYTFTYTTTTGSQACSYGSCCPICVENGNCCPTLLASGPTLPICAGTTLSLSATPSPATPLVGLYSYAWAGTGTFNTSTSQNPAVLLPNTLAAGNYTYTVTLSNGSCNITATTSIVVKAKPIATNGSLSVCEGGSIQLSAPANMAAYAWTGPSQYQSNIQNPTVSTNATLALSGNYLYTITNASGCTNKGTFSVTVSAKPSIGIKTNSPVCVGNILSLSAGGGGTYSWAGPNGFISNNATEILSPVVAAMSGIYSLTVTGTNSCTNSATTNVIVNEQGAGASSNGPVCVGQELRLTSTNGGDSYSWAGPNGFLSSLQNPAILPATLSNGGVYSVTITGDNQCTGTASVSVVIWPLPTATATNATAQGEAVCEGISIGLSASGGTTYTWSGPNGFGSFQQNPTIQNPTTASVGVYSVTVTDANGCSNTATTSVKVKKCYGSIGDYVWKDRNENGIQEIGEVGVGNIKVELYRTDANGVVQTGGPIATATTDASGLYVFDNLTTGFYKVRFVISSFPADCALTKQDQGPDDFLDSDADPTTGFSQNILIDTTQTGILKDNMTIDAGLKANCLPKCIPFEIKSKKP